MGRNNFLVIAEWEHATPVTIAWPELDEARATAKRIFETSNCRRVTIHEHKGTGVFETLPAETLERIEA